MRKRIAILSFILGSSLYSSAQTTFQKTYGGPNSDGSYFVQLTSDGGYFIVGTTILFGSPNFDFYLVKTDINGDLLWTKTYGSFQDERAASGLQTSDGGYIAVGYTTSFGAWDEDVYLVKTNANGDSLWTKTFGGTGYDAASFIQQTSDEGYIITGLTNAFGAGNMDVFLIKIDSNANAIWTKSYGGINDDRGNSVQQTTDGGYVITGSTKSFGSGNTDVYLIKTNGNGDTLWTKAFGGTANESGNSVQQTLDGGYIITGWTDSFGEGYTDVYLIKTDVNGDLLWTKTFGGYAEDEGESVQSTADGGYIIGGSSSTFALGASAVYLIKVDSNGDSLWTKRFCGVFDDNGHYAQETTDGGYVITGETYSFGQGSYAVYLIKTDSNGNSGCNQAPTATIINTPSTILSGTSTIVSSIASVVTSPASFVSSSSTAATLCFHIGIDDLTEDESLLISPNPSDGNIFLIFERFILNGQVEVLDILGENVFTESIFSETKKEINLKYIANGIYFVKVFDGEKYYFRKIIIEQN